MNESGEGTKYSMDAYVSDLLAAKGMNDDSETHAELLEQVEKVVDQAVIDALPSGDKTRLEYIASNNPTEEEVTNILENADFNVDAVIKQTLENFRDRFLAGGEK